MYRLVFRKPQWRERAFISYFLIILPSREEASVSVDGSRLGGVAKVYQLFAMMLSFLSFPNWRAFVRVINCSLSRSAQEVVLPHDWVSVVMAAPAYLSPSGTKLLPSVYQVTSASTVEVILQVLSPHVPGLHGRCTGLGFQSWG